jgi:hypothetical protein
MDDNGQTRFGSPTNVPGGEQRRRHGRVVCQDIKCTVGEVVDLSASGMRVETGRKCPAIGTEITTMIETLEGPLPFAGVVVWSRRVGLFKFHIGIEFRNLNDAMRAALARLARASAQNETLRY